VALPIRIQYALPSKIIPGVKNPGLRAPVPLGQNLRAPGSLEQNHRRRVPFLHPSGKAPPKKPLG